MTIVSNSRNPSFSIDGKRIRVVIAEQAEQELERRPLAEQEEIFWAMVGLGVDRLVNRRGVTEVERKYGVLGLDAANADVGNFRIWMTFIDCHSTLVMQLRRRLVPLQEDNDGGDDDHTPGGGQRRGTIAERLACELQAAADENEAQEIPDCAMRVANIEVADLMAHLADGRAGKGLVMVRLAVPPPQRWRAGQRRLVLNRCAMPACGTRCTKGFMMCQARESVGSFPGSSRHFGAS